MPLVAEAHSQQQSTRNRRSPERTAFSAAETRKSASTAANTGPQGLSVSCVQTHLGFHPPPGSYSLWTSLISCCPPLGSCLLPLAYRLFQLHSLPPAASTNRTSSIWTSCHDLTQSNCPQFLRSHPYKPAPHRLFTTLVLPSAFERYNRAITQNTRSF